MSAPLRYRGAMFYKFRSHRLEAERHAREERRAQLQPAPPTCPPLVPYNEPADFAFIFDPVNGSKIVRIDRKKPDDGSPMAA